MATAIVLIQQSKYISIGAVPLPMLLIHSFHNVLKQCHYTLGVVCWSLSNMTDILILPSYESQELAWIHDLGFELVTEDM